MKHGFYLIKMILLALLVSSCHCLPVSTGQPKFAQPNKEYYRNAKRALHNYRASNFLFGNCDLTKIGRGTYEPKVQPLTRKEARKCVFKLDEMVYYTINWNKIICDSVKEFKNSKELFAYLQQDLHADYNYDVYYQGNVQLQVNLRWSSIDKKYSAYANEYVNSRNTFCDYAKSQSDVVFVIPISGILSNYPCYQKGDELYIVNCCDNGIPLKDEINRLIKCGFYYNRETGKTIPCH